MTGREFLKHVIAQDDDCDYDESGYVACVVGGEAYIAHYAHCSCYDTWASIAGSDGEPVWDWKGSVEQMMQMVREGRDPAYPDAFITDSTIDADHLRDMYVQIEEWYTKRSGQ